MAENRLTPQQQAVVDNQGGTLLVSAAAGSGKTKVLVDRVMDRIIRQGKNIHEFLIITFTNAAAGELRLKISDAIAKALMAQPDNRHLQRQINLVSMAQISTVHAFCGSLIRQYGYMLEIPSDFSMLDDPQREEMLSQILEDILDEAYEKKDPGFILLTDTLGAGRNDHALVDLVKNVFEKLLSQPYPQKWLDSQTLYLEENTDLTQNTWGKLLISDAKQQLLWLKDRYEWAISMMQDDEKLSPKYLPCYIQHRDRIAVMLEALEGPWDEIGETLTMEYPRLVVQKYPDQELLEAIKAVRNDGKKLLEKLRGQFSRSSQILIQEQNDLAPALDALLKLVGKLYRQFSQEKRRKNKMDFSDQEHLAIRLLINSNGTPTEVAREVSERFTEIMVDEYQDSNRVQELIYTAISKEGDHNRFLVGDVKQSIYGFRQAEPEIFIEKYQSYTPAEQAMPLQPRYLVLSKNFRSRPEILSAANHVFSTVMTPELGGLSYDEEQQLYPGLDSYPRDDIPHVELNVLSLTKQQDGRDDDSTKYQREALWVTNRIVKLLQDRVPVRDGEGVRPVRPEDIAILFRSRDPMRHYQRALTQAGLPVASDTGEDIFETPEVQVLLNLLRVLDNPHQDVPLLSVLCSPLFRMSNQELAKIRIGSRKPRFYDALMDSDETFAVQVQERLHAFRAVANQLSAESLVWYLLYDAGLLTAYSAMDQGETRRNHLLMIYELACSAAGGKHLYLYELVRYLDRQAENGLASPAGGSGGITLTTIHKSKGLEYPVVFLCDLSRKFNFRELTENVLVDSDDGIGTKITDVSRRIRYSGLAYDALKIKKHRKLLSEELRVLYVAMTRPKDYLFMTYACVEGAGIFSKLLPGVGTPADPWAAAGAACLGDWILLSAMNRIEAGTLFSECGRPQCQLLVSDHPWDIRMETVDKPEIIKYMDRQTAEDSKDVFIPSPEKLIDALRWKYPHEKSSVTPSKLTATQLKGRDKDQEAAENAPTAISIPQLRRPDFILAQKGLSPTEKGTATHLFLQYADFHALTTEDGIIEELDRLVDQEFITELQADAISTEAVMNLFSSDLGRRLLQANKLIREFKFSILWEAEDYYEGMAGEQVLLQGVVDAAIVEEDGITVVDFKTDRVNPQGASQRAEVYREQLETYKKALSRIFGIPVKETLLYFLTPGVSVKL